MLQSLRAALQRPLQSSVHAALHATLWSIFSVNLLQLNLFNGRQPRRPAGMTAAVLLPALLFALTACGGNETASPTVLPAAVTAETGGMALPGAPSAGAAASTTVTATPAPPATEPPLLAAGAVITAAGSVVVYAEPDPAALRFGAYKAGSRFTVIEPDGDRAEYPVVVAGQRWYRVRAEDGLVGWVVETPSEP
jgi:hypothetical protein